MASGHRAPGRRRKTRCRCFFPISRSLRSRALKRLLCKQSAGRQVWRNPRGPRHRSEPSHGGDTSDSSLLAESDRCATGEANITRGARNVCGIAPDPKGDGEPVDFTVLRLNTKMWLCHNFAVLRLKMNSLTSRWKRPFRPVGTSFPRVG